MNSSLIRTFNYSLTQNSNLRSIEDVLSGSNVEELLHRSVDLFRVRIQMSEVAQLDAEFVPGDWDDLEGVSWKVDRHVRANRVNLFGRVNPLLVVLESFESLIPKIQT